MVCIITFRDSFIFLRFLVFMIFDDGDIHSLLIMLAYLKFLHVSIVNFYLLGFCTILKLSLVLISMLFR